MGEEIKAYIDAFDERARADLALVYETIRAACRNSQLSVFAFQMDSPQLIRLSTPFSQSRLRLLTCSELLAVVDI